MIYLDNGATSFHKPICVQQAMFHAMQRCANPGRGGYGASEAAARTVYRCREEAGALFDCQPEQVVFTSNCTHGLNIAIRTLVKPGATVVISGFEHNAVTRPLHALGAKIKVAGRKLFDWDDTLTEFESALRGGADAVIFTHVSNVFGYILPVCALAGMCKRHGVPFIVDAAQSAGVLPVQLGSLGAEFIAMPGHKGLLGPQGTGVLLCRDTAQPMIMGGTGSDSVNQAMPELLPDRLEAGTLNVPGIAGLCAGMRYLRKRDIRRIFAAEHMVCMDCIDCLKNMGYTVFSGENQCATVSFLPKGDCEAVAGKLAEQGVAVRAGLHCAPLAHKSAGTLETGTVRVSFGHDAAPEQVDILCRALMKC